VWQHGQLARYMVAHYPIAVPGGLFSIGDSHAARGDSELCGTAIECYHRLLLKQHSPAGAEYLSQNLILKSSSDLWIFPASAACSQNLNI
jgi:acetamidase/formamidase